MSETVNIGEIANKISEDIFKFFRWQSHPKRDDNFKCTNSDHKIKNKPVKVSAENSEEDENNKKTHPGDVLFFYQDPYLGSRVYLHTDLKSYAKETISRQKIRSAIESLAMTIDCARNSDEWRRLYSVPDDCNHEVRGLLFVYNHDGNYQKKFSEAIKTTDLSTIPVAPNVYVHFLGPEDISRLYTITNDIVRLQHAEVLPKEYSFYYPDLVMWRNQEGIFNQPATIESLTAPYFIINYKKQDSENMDYLIYYNRSGESVDEFEYFLDSLSRYQMLEPGKKISVRLVSKTTDQNFLSNFYAAKERYARAWGLGMSRIDVLNDIKIDQVIAVAAAYTAPALGWKENK